MDVERLHRFPGLVKTSRSCRYKPLPQSVVPRSLGPYPDSQVTPEGRALVEVTCRTPQSRFLLRPSPELNDLVVGVFGRASPRDWPRVHCAPDLADGVDLQSYWFDRTKEVTLGFQPS